MAGPFERDCPTCGIRFSFGSGRGQARKYCSKGCISPRQSPSDPCTVAGCVRPRRSHIALYCEAHYYRLRRNGSLELPQPVQLSLTCVYCGNGTRSGRKYCGPVCQARHRRDCPIVKVCIICAKEYDPRWTRGRDSPCCSQECRAKRTRQLGKQCYTRAMQTEKGREKIRAAEYKRKAKKRAAFVEDVSRDEVMRRDGWECYLCEQPIPETAVWPEPMFGTVDHVKALALGGEHSYANCRAAHLRCNLIKGARPLGGGSQ